MSPVEAFITVIFEWQKVCFITWLALLKLWLYRSKVRLQLHILDSLIFTVRRLPWSCDRLSKRALITWFYFDLGRDTSTHLSDYSLLCLGLVLPDLCLSCKRQLSSYLLQHRHIGIASCKHLTKKFIGKSIIMQTLSLKSGAIGHKLEYTEIPGNKDVGSIYSPTVTVDFEYSIYYSKKVASRLKSWMNVPGFPIEFSLQVNPTNDSEPILCTTCETNTCTVTHAQSSGLRGGRKVYHRMFLARFSHFPWTFLSENWGDRSSDEVRSSALAVLPALYNGLREDFCVIADRERGNKSDLTKGTLWVSFMTRCQSF